MSAMPGAPLSPSLLKQVRETQYLNVENTPRYRLILRYFFEQYERQKDWLATEEVAAHVREVFDASYDEQQAAADLECLQAWGNLLAEQDRKRARTIEEFHNRQLVHHVTPVTIRVETMLREIEQSTGNRGSLDPTLLERLWAMLEHLRIALSREIPAQPEKQFLLEQIRRPWLDAYHYFQELTGNANAFHHALHEARPTDLTRTTAFLAYKDVLLTNLEGFINLLMDFADRIRGVLALWRKSGALRRLEDLLVDYEARYEVHLNTADGPELWRERHQREIASLTEWFQPGGGCDILRNTTAFAIEGVMHHTRRLVDPRQMGASRLSDLEHAARAFSGCRTLDEAHSLASAMLGCATARYLQGSADQFEMKDTAPVWEQRPRQVPLKRMRQGRKSRLREILPRHTEFDRQALLDEEDSRRQAEAVAWDELFVSGEINLGNLTVQDASLRSRLLDITGQCLVSTDGSATAPDGSRIELRYPLPGEYESELKGPDGIFVTPQFRLRRMV